MQTGSSDPVKDSCLFGLPDQFHSNKYTLSLWTLPGNVHIDTCRTSSRITDEVHTQIIYLPVCIEKSTRILIAIVINRRVFSRARFGLILVWLYHHPIFQGIGVVVAIVASKRWKEQERFKSLELSTDSSPYLLSFESNPLISLLLCSSIVHLSTTCMCLCISGARG